MTGDELHWRCAGGIVSILQGLVPTTLAGIETKDILRQWVFDPRDLEFPGIVCLVEDETETLLGGDTSYKRIRYPVRVYLLDTERVQPEQANKYAGWRNAMIQSLHQRPRPYANGAFGQLIPGVDEAQDTQVAPMPVIQLQNQIYERVVSGFRVNVECTVARG